MGIDSRLKGIVTLLGDSDEVVVKAINQHLLSRGVSVLDDLDLLYKKENSKSVKVRIANKIKFLNEEFAFAAIKNQAKHKQIDLLDTIVNISTLLGFEVDKIALSASIFSQCASLQTHIYEKLSPKEKIDIFNLHFYKTISFENDNRVDFSEDNMLVTNVLLLRKGSAVALSILYFLYARAVGIPIHPLCFKGGLIPVYVENDNVLFYMDIFREGEVFFENQLVNFLNSQMYGGEPVEIVFEVREDRVLIVVYLEALLQIYSGPNNQRRRSLIERTLKCFGEERFLNILDEEEDTDEL